MSEPGARWKKLLLAAGGTAAVAGVVYYLLQKDETTSNVEDGAGSDHTRELGKRGVKAEEISKKEVQQVLQEIIQSQEQMKIYMKELTKELLSKQDMTFEQTYDQVKKVQPNDPLEKYGLSMMDFDQLLDKYQSDPAVREAIAKIMGAPNPQNTASEKVQAITVKKILEVHQFMLEELETLVKYFQSVQNKGKYDMKTVTIAAQAIVGSKVEMKFGITSEDIESGVLMYHTVLATDQEFSNINVKIQHTMGKLIGHPH